MPRDWDLIRLILLRLDEKPTSASAVGPAEIPEHPAELVSYQIRLLLDSGLVDGTWPTRGGQLFCVAKSLTWDGHEFLDKTRSLTMWNRIKEILRDKELDLSFDAIKAAALIVLGKWIS